jgi:hypothetical protein
MGNKAWNKQWKSYIKGLSSLLWIPDKEDSHRVQEIMEELAQIVDRNTSKK